MTGGNRYLDSTEIFIPALSQASWTDVGKLPSPRGSLAAVSLNNNVFVMGNDFKQHPLNTFQSFFCKVAISQPKDFGLTEMQQLIVKF